MKLTERTVRNAEPPSTGDRLITDEELPGFRLRIGATGVRSYTFQYSIDGRERRLTIGRSPAWTAAAARERAKQLRRMVDLGQDPLAGKQERRDAPTFEAVAEQFLERYASRKKSGDRDAAYLRNDAIAAWGRRKAADVTRADVIALLERRAIDAPVSANRLHSVLRKTFAWAVEVQLLEANPCVGISKPATETSRDRVLTAEEIRRFWTALDAGGVSPVVGAALKMVLVTCARPGEVAALHRSEIEGRWWTVPSWRSKNRLAHRAWLGKTALEVIEAAGSGGGFVFGSRNAQGKRPITVRAMSAALRRKRLSHTVHDLRRTTASHLASLGVANFTIRRLLNHRESGSTQVDVRAAFDREKKAALERWDAELRRIVFGESAAKVVPIHG